MTKRCIKFHFFDNRGFGSWCVKTRLGSTISHCGMEFENGRFYHSSFLTGTVSSTLTEQPHPPVTTTELWVDEEAYKRAEVFCKAQVGSHYDYKALLGFVFTTKYQHKTAWFCSEYGRLCFERATGLEIYWPKLCAPHELRIMVDTYTHKKLTD